MNKSISRMFDELDLEANSPERQAERRLAEIEAERVLPDLQDTLRQAYMSGQTQAAYNHVDTMVLEALAGLVNNEPADGARKVKAEVRPNQQQWRAKTGEMWLRVTWTDPRPRPKLAKPIGPGQARIDALFDHPVFDGKGGLIKDGAK